MSDGDGYVAPGTGAGVNCYSEGEGGFMEWGQRLRGTALRPLLRWMDRIGMRAGHVTALSLLAGLAFCPFLLWGSPLVALIINSAQMGAAPRPPVIPTPFASRIRIPRSYPTQTETLRVGVNPVNQASR